MSSEQEQIMVPVADLMCIDLRMSSLLRDTRPIHRKEMPLFLTLLEDVIERWYTAVGSMNAAIYEKYNEHSQALRELTESFSRVSDDDTEHVFEERERLGINIERFYTLMDSFAGAFTGPKELREFYYNINSRVRLTIEAMTEGKHGW
jgi:hypothetical protein